MVLKRIKSPLRSFLEHLLGSFPFLAVLIFVSNCAVGTEWWQSWIIARQTAVCFVFSVLFASWKCLCRHVKEKKKQNSRQKAKANVYDEDYHRVCESQVHLSRDHETSKATISDLKEEVDKLKKQLKDKDLALAQMTKKNANLKKELRLKEEKLNHVTQQAIGREREDQELTNKLNEANNSLNGQLIQVQQQSDALADRNEMLESQLHAKDLELSELKEKVEAYKNEVTLLEDNLTKRNQVVVSLEDKLSQLEEELTASRDQVTSLEETLTNKEHQIRQHEEVLNTIIEHVMSDLDDLSMIHNETLIEATIYIVYLNHLVCHLMCLPPPQLVVCSALVFQCNNDYSLEGNDITELYERDDEEVIPPDHFNPQYTYHALVTNTLTIDEWNYPLEAISYRSQVSSDIDPVDVVPCSLEYIHYNGLVVAPVDLPFLAPDVAPVNIALA